MVEVVATDEFAGWYGDLPATEAESVTRVVDLLAARGVQLGFPHSSAIKGSELALREL